MEKHIYTSITVATLTAARERVLDDLHHLTDGEAEKALKYAAEFAELDKIIRDYQNREKEREELEARAREWRAKPTTEIIAEHEKTVRETIASGKAAEREAVKERGMHYIAKATGSRLDELAELHNVERCGRSDEDFREYLINYIMSDKKHLEKECKRYLEE